MSYSPLTCDQSAKDGRPVFRCKGIVVNINNDQYLNSFLNCRLSDLEEVKLAKLFPSFGTITSENFFRSTYAVFSKVSAIPNVKPDFISADGSEYVYAVEGVFRKADHWGTLKYCSWGLNTPPTRFGCKKGAIEIGFCKWTDFIQKPLKLNPYKNKFKQSVDNYFSFTDTDGLVQINEQIFSRATIGDCPQYLAQNSTTHV